MWTYESSTGYFLRPDGLLFGAGYSGGNCGLNPEGKNNPDMDNVPKVGPIPRGLYVIGWETPNPKLGELAMPLTPSPATVMHGRSGFWIHGDLIGHPGEGSEGCIILGYAARVELALTLDRVLKVQ